MQSRCAVQNDGVLFGLPVVMDTRDDSVAVGDKILLTYQVSSQTWRNRAPPSLGYSICLSTHQLHMFCNDTAHVMSVDVQVFCRPSNLDQAYTAGEQSMCNAFVFPCS